MGRMILVMVVLALTGCQSLMGDAKSVDIPAGCATAAESVVEIVDEAQGVIRTAEGKAEVIAWLKELTKKHDRPTLSCALSAYLAIRGGEERLSSLERETYEFAKAGLEKLK